jgi:hypothetical protein
MPTRPRPRCFNAEALPSMKSPRVPPHRAYGVLVNNGSIKEETVAEFRLQVEVVRDAR